MSILRKIKDRVARNYHGAAYSLGLEYLRDFFTEEELDDLRDELLRVVRAHERIGHLTPELNVRRHAVYEAMMGAARKHLSSEDYTEFHSCF